MFNHRLTHTESPETQNMIGLTYFDHGHPIICKIYVRGPYGEIMWFEIVFLIDLTWFWQSKMLNYIFFRGKIKFGDRRYSPFTPIMSICIWSGSRKFNRTDCSMLFRPFLDLKIDLRDIRVRSRHPCAPTHHPGPFEHIKFRIFFPRSPPPCLDHQNHDF